jgi:hypothetical protein
MNKPNPAHSAKATSQTLRVSRSDGSTLQRPAVPWLLDVMNRSPEALDYPV